MPRFYEVPIPTPRLCETQPISSFAADIGWIWMIAPS